MSLLETFTYSSWLWVPAALASFALAAILLDRYVDSREEKE